MKVSDYKMFKESVMKAEKNDLIWCYGFLFLQLTDRQAQDLFKATYSKYKYDENKVRFPNGFTITGKGVN